MSYSFQFDVLVNGVPAKGKNVQIGLDGEGNVTRLSRQLSINEFPSATPKVTFDEAVKFARDNQQVELQYMPLQKGDGTISSWYLGFVPAISPIDAETGKFLENGMNSFKVPTYKAVPATENTYSGNKEAADLSSDQASNRARELLQIPKDKVVLHSSLQSNWGSSGDKQWYITFGDNPEAGFEGQLSVTVNAQTGDILSYYSNRFTPYQEKTKLDPTLPTITKDEAEKRAIVLLNKLYPNASQELKQAVREEAGGNKKAPVSYSFTFQRFHNSLPISADNVNITLDLQGNLLNYYANRNNIKLTALDVLKPVITKEKALEILWKNTKVELQYLQTGSLYDREQQEPVVNKLVYNQSLKDNQVRTIIDAVDGSWKQSWYGIMDQSAPVQPSDLKGHSAEKELETLLQHKVLSTDEAGKVNPNQVVTIGEWWTMMARAITVHYTSNVGSYAIKQPFADIDEKSPYYDAVRFSLQFGWLEANATEKLSPDQELTREQLASYLIAVAKYKKLSKELVAKLPGLSYADASLITNKGDVWLAVQLGLLQTKDGKFNPKDKVTRAEAAVAIMNLVYSQGKLDQNVSGSNPF
ncbi:S-layer homology domain-containing protein [Paenibacillus sp. N1-5-1-14]|uniref:YcdB/YcdC domain-containing protein n=1 Tax=Paenibacillus radicibacter TaxID=2972488 RepID=UPI002158CA7B|nr:YcdB/YcdC domain-containing protein [Paenibacillus radicibacter]MCR8645689.1 S-layer homology domain-containing protein [Paenibacillus radicibacter]